MKTNLKLNISFIFKMVSLMLVCIISLYSSKLILNKNKFALIMAPMRDSNVSILWDYKFTDTPIGEKFCYSLNADNYEKDLNFIKDPLTISETINTSFSINRYTNKLCYNNWGVDNFTVIPKDLFNDEEFIKIIIMAPMRDSNVSILWDYKFTDTPIGEKFCYSLNADNYEKDLNFIKDPLTISETINTLFSINRYTNKLCYNNWGVDNFTVIPKDLFNDEEFIKINPYDSIAIRDDAIEFSDSKVTYCFLPNLFLYGSDHTQTRRAVLLKLTAISKFT